MSAKNPEYDFKWCPGCGDFGVRRAIEFGMAELIQQQSMPMERNVVVAGIGCSGNLVHLLEGPQPYGFHGIHGRSLPIAMGVKMARPELNVVIVAGDGDFLSIGGEHIAPQAARNLNVCAVIMDNGVYGLTKGQSSPTTLIGTTTSSTPYGKMEQEVNALELYLAMGVSFIASGFSSQPRVLANIVRQGMEHPGFAIVNVQSPCTTYNDTYELIKGNVKKGIAPSLWEIPPDHDASDKDAAKSIVAKGGLPIGILYKDTSRPSFDSALADLQTRVKPSSVEELLNSYAL